MDATELMHDFSIAREIDYELANIIKNTFPGAVVPGGGQTNNSFRAYLSRENRHFSSTDYFFKGEMKFFHLTSLSNVLSILNSRSIRLYDLNSSADPDEYTYAADAMGMKTGFIDSMKKNVFTFSFCQYSNIKNAHIWNEYGKNSTGAAIVFEVVNEPKNWQNFHMSEIKYVVPDKIKQFRTEIEKLERRRNIVVDFDPSRFVAFHKKDLFLEEREVRLLTHSPYPTFHETFKHTKLDYRLADDRHPKNRLTTYFDLPLWVNDMMVFNYDERAELDRKQNLPADFFNTRPKIVIKDVLIGCNTNLDYNEFVIIKDKIEEIISVNFGYSVQLSLNLFDPSCLA
jgi:hypothetical protein